MLRLLARGMAEGSNEECPQPPLNPLSSWDIKGEAEAN